MKTKKIYVIIKQQLWGDSYLHTEAFNTLKEAKKVYKELVKNKEIEIDFGCSFSIETVKLKS